MSGELVANCQLVEALIPESVSIRIEFSIKTGILGDAVMLRAQIALALVESELVSCATQLSCAHAPQL